MGETDRVPVIEYARTRIYQQSSAAVPPARQSRTPGPVRPLPPAIPETVTRPIPMRASAPAVPTLPALPRRSTLPMPPVEVLAPGARGGSLPHPRLVRRPRATPMPAPSATLPRVLLRPESRDPDELDDQPTGEITATRPRKRKRVYR
jgi:hypothetical protein